MKAFLKEFLKEVFQSLRSTLKWLLIFALVSGAGIVVVVILTQWEAYQHAVHQVAARTTRWDG